MTRFGSQPRSRARKVAALGTLAAPLSLLLALSPELARATPAPVAAASLLASSVTPGLGWALALAPGNRIDGLTVEEQDDGTMVRKDGDLTVKIDPCSGEVTVKAETEETVSQEAKRDATGFNDVGPSEKSLRDRVKDQLKSDLDKKFEHEQAKLQGKATEALEKHLQDIQPEISEVVNQVTRDALKQKAQQLGTVKEVSEDAESGSLTIKVEV